MMHYAVTHQTAAEIIYDRADAEKPHMGLMTWKNAPDGRVVKSDKDWNIERLKALAGNLQEPLLCHLSFTKLS